MMEKRKLGAFLSVVLLLLAAGIVGGIIVWLTLGSMVASKLATALLLPAGLFWVCLLAATIYFAIKRRRTASICFLAFWAAFSILGNSFLSDRLALALEGPYRKIAPFEGGALDVVVVLGGGAALGANGRMQGSTNGDRIILAAELYRRGLAGRLICTGQRIVALDSTGVDPAEASAGILVDLGVPRNAIDLVPGETTSQEVKNLEARFKGSATRVGLLTSAWHLPRAMKLAARVGFHPHPIPSDFLYSPRNTPLTVGWLLQGIIPDSDVITKNTTLLRECLGMLVGR